MKGGMEEEKGSGLVDKHSIEAKIYTNSVTYESIQVIKTLLPTFSFAVA